MHILSNIEVLIAHLKAEIAVLEAKLETVLHTVASKAEAAGVDMPTSSVAVAPQTPAPQQNSETTDARAQA